MLPRTLRLRLRPAPLSQHEPAYCTSDAGRLVILHASDFDPRRGKNGFEEVWRKRYFAGAMLLDLDNPYRVVGVYKEPLMVPEAPYETTNGYRNNVIYPRGSSQKRTERQKSITAPRTPGSPWPSRISTSSSLSAVQRRRCRPGSGLTNRPLLPTVPAATRGSRRRSPPHSGALPGSTLAAAAPP